MSTNGWYLYLQVQTQDIHVLKCQVREAHYKGNRHISLTVGLVLRKMNEINMFCVYLSFKEY